MPHYQRHGDLPPKRFTVLRRPSGGIYHEELLGTDGFVGESSTLYHLHPPTRIVRVEPFDAPELKPWSGPAQNMLFHVDRLAAVGDYHASRIPMFFNADVLFSIARPDAPTNGFSRNAEADELVVVVEGSGRLDTAFGRLTYGPLDIVVIPRGVTSRWIPDDEVPQCLVVVETRASVAPPARYRSASGQLLDSAPYHERDIRTPTFGDPVDSGGEFTVVVHAGTRSGRYVFDRHPFDVVGWDGCVYPYAVNMRDVEPLSGRVHPLPDQYQVFAAEGVAIACLVPHVNADHPDASPAQAHHMNADYDEVFYRFGVRSDTREPAAGTITLHPRGLAHGPKPGYEQLARPPYVETWGLMVDTRQRLEPTMRSMDALDDGYAATWL